MSHRKNPIPTPVSVGQVPDPHSQSSLLVCHALVAVAGPGQCQHTWQARRLLTP